MENKEMKQIYRGSFFGGQENEFQLLPEQFNTDEVELRIRQINSSPLFWNSAPVSIYLHNANGKNANGGVAIDKQFYSGDFPCDHPEATFIKCESSDEFGMYEVTVWKY